MFLFRHGKKVKKRVSWKKILVIVSVFLAVISAALVYWYNSNLRPVDSSNNDLVVVTVSEGMNEAQFAAMLEEKSLIRSAFSYEIFARLHGKTGKMQAGAYKLAKSMDVEAIINRIVDGDVAVDLMTILPAQRLDQLEQSFLELGYSPEEVKKALDPDNYSSHSALADKPPLASLEGYLYPESFQHTATTPLRAIIEASLDQMDIALSDELKQKFKEQGLTVHEAVTFASIVEKEVSNQDDRPIVAQVFLSRFKQNMTLGSDVTAYYGASLLGLEETVTVDSPYNTRIYAGLPPGPISNVSVSSLRAVAYPSNTDYLFFVSGDDGKTYFSHTVAEHESLISQHCKKLCELP